MVPNHRLNVWSTYYKTSRILKKAFVTTLFGVPNSNKHYFMTHYIITNGHSKTKDCPAREIIITSQLGAGVLTIIETSNFRIAVTLSKHPSDPRRRRSSPIQRTNGTPLNPPGGKKEMVHHERNVNEDGIKSFVNTE